MRLGHELERRVSRPISLVKGGRETQWFEYGYSHVIVEDVVYDRLSRVAGRS
jgi:hypothetical protein